jgi:hypothetical protein
VQASENIPDDQIGSGRISRNLPVLDSARQGRKYPKSLALAAIATAQIEEKLAVSLEYYVACSSRLMFLRPDVTPRAEGDGAVGMPLGSIL